MLECHALGDDFEFISIRFTVTVRLNDNDFLAEFSISRRSPKTPSKRSFLFSGGPLQRNQQKLQPSVPHQGNLELILAWLVEQTPEAVLEESEGHEADFSIESIRHREARSSAIKQDPRIQVVVDCFIAHPQAL